jgi:hypothetical protein
LLRSAAQGRFFFSARILRDRAEPRRGDVGKPEYKLLFTAKSFMFKSQNMLNSIWNDLFHAARSLAKARAFTFVCVLSLGIGMAPVIAIPYLSRILTIQPPGVKTEGLVEILTTRVGARAATDTWSYPDYVDLRDANTGTALVAGRTGKARYKKTPCGQCLFPRTISRRSA